jgi:cytidyltransferase-like protein
MRQMDCGVCLGSFDPIHDGHVAMIVSALRLVDRLLVVAGSNPLKSHRPALLTVAERVELIKNLFPSDRVIVEAHQEDFVAQVRRHGALMFIQGIREPKDAVEGWPYLTHMAEEAPDMLTVFVHTKSTLSSSEAREMVAQGRFDELHCPPVVLERLRQKYASSS